MILLDKPAGVTSFQALNALKKLAPSAKVGHAGTLDKFATGLLVAVSGWCTRLVPWLADLDKRYIARVRFGEETDTLDPEGSVIARAAVPAYSAIEEAVSRFVGPIEQIPPVYSAVHAAGGRAYKLARAGKDVELRPRAVIIHELEIIDVSLPEIVVAVHCSKGTYIRSLARDIGISSGSRAFVTALRRTQVGPFQVAKARPPHTITFGGEVISPAEALAAVGSMLFVTASDEVLQNVANGRKISPADLDNAPDSDGAIVVTGRDGTMAAIVEKRGDSYRYQLVVPSTGE
ncbi:MAG: tRNA pseudouridine(55) synthase TruB [Spirochaetales bacterium]|nr:tRNA pseudouridine(55) synthase TruB [Spirochaetales bacterium]